jgi:hypothetical protein
MTTVAYTHGGAAARARAMVRVRGAVSCVAVEPAASHAEPSRHPRSSDSVQRLSRLILCIFLLTFIAARVLVYLIMSRSVPDLYVHVGGTHVHHLNYGIFLLSGVGAVLILGRPQGRPLRMCAAVYAVGLALTFDEFGMWLHLGGPYWQRASFDAVVVIAAVLGLIGVAPPLARFAPRHWIASAAILLSLVVFGVTWKQSMAHAEQRLKVRLETIEAQSPP